MIAQDRLFWYPGTCSRVPYVALEEIGDPFDLTLVDRMVDPAPEYLALNPEGRVPTLVSNGSVIFENLAIQTYLHREHPDANLLPTGSPDTEIAVMQMQSWFASGVHPLVRQMRFPRFYSDDASTHDAIRAKALPQLKRIFSVIDARLEGREWLFGEWSLLDVHLLWLWFRATGIGFDGTPYVNCIAHAARCEARPSVARVLDEEEAGLKRLREAELIPNFVPDFQAGRSRQFTGQ